MVDAIVGRIYYFADNARIAAYDFAKEDVGVTATAE